MANEDQPTGPGSATALAALRERVASLEGQLATLEQVLNQQTEWICRFRPDSTLTFVNRAYADGLQTPPEQLLGRPFFDFIPPEDHDEVRAHLATLGPERRVGIFEHRIRMPDGRLSWHQWTEQVVLDEQGQVREIQAIGRNITARKLAQAQLIAQRDLAQALAGIASLDVALPICLDIAIQISQMDCGGFYLFDPASGDLNLVYAQNLSESFIAHTSYWPAGSDRVRLVLEGNPCYAPYTPTTFHVHPVEGSEGLRAVAVLPLSYQGQIIGCFNIGSHTLEDVPPEARSALEAVAAQVGQAIARIQAEEALRSSQQQWQALFDSLQDFLFVLDHDGTILRVNRLVLQRLGYSEDELIGRPVLMIHPPEQHAEAMAIIAEMVDGQREVCPLALVTRAGRQIPVETRVTSGRWGNRTALFGVSRDISEHLRIETALRESEARLRALVHNFPNGAAFLFDHNLRCLVADGYELTRLGYASNDLEGRSLIEVLPPSIATPLEPIYRAALAGSSPTQVELALNSSWYHLTAVPIRDEAGATVAGMIIALNVSAQKHTQAILNEQAQAMAAMREREHLARELHDSLGQVLAYINVQSQTIRNSISDGRLAKADAALASLIAVVQESQLDVREFILAARARRPSEIAAPGAGGLIPGIERHLQWLAEIYDFHTELSLAEAVRAIEISPLVEVQLLRIVQEALTNVRKHSGTRQAQVQFQLVDDQLTVVVRDDGRGFDLAGSLAAAAANVGSGFGLQGMRERAEEIESSLSIMSSPGQGTAVRLEVPLRHPVARGLAEVRVLLVDDSPLFLQGLQQLLQAHGFIVVGAVGDGLTALEWARTLQPNVILMDIEMPGISGIEAMRAILAELPGLYVVMLTVAEDEATLFEALKAGAAGYLLKSMDAEDLCNQLIGVARGEAALSGGLALRVLRELAIHQADAPPDINALAVTLTPQEVKVLTLLAQGYTYRAIGQQLDYSERAIKYHTGNAIKKLQLKTRAAAVAFARQQIQRGLWPQPDVSREL